MKCYEIKRGTRCGVITQRPHEDPVVRRWVTRRDNMFTETVIDPNRIYNNPRGGTNKIANELARRGYYVFGGECGSDADATHLLAVPADNIMVR